jgi:hypothetical protein
VTPRTLALGGAITAAEVLEAVAPLTQHDDAVPTGAA